MGESLRSDDRNIRNCSEFFSYTKPVLHPAFEPVAVNAGLVKQFLQVVLDPVMCTSPLEPVCRHNSARAWVASRAAGALGLVAGRFPAASRIELHTSGSIGHAGWRSLSTQTRLMRLVLWCPLYCYPRAGFPACPGRGIIESIRRSSGRRASSSAPGQKSSTAVMRRSLAREKVSGSTAACSTSWLQ